MNFTPLEMCILDLSCDWWPQAADAVYAKWGDEKYMCRVLASTLRRIIEGGGQTWFYEVAVKHRADLLKLAPYIGTVQMPWGPMPGALGWPEWIRQINVVDGFGETETPAPVKLVQRKAA